MFILGLILILFLYGFLFFISTWFYFWLRAADYGDQWSVSVETGKTELFLPEPEINYQAVGVMGSPERT